MAKKVQVIGYMCEKCGRIYADNNTNMNEYLADMCCKQYYCDVCGKPTAKYNYLCPECAEKQKLDKANKMTYQEYIKEFPDCPLWWNDEFYYDLEELKEFQYDNNLEMPEYVWGTKKEPVEIDIESVIQNTEEDCGLEDFYFENTQELIDFVTKWNKENGTNAYYPTYKIAIMLSPQERTFDNEHN